MRRNSHLDRSAGAKTWYGTEDDMFASVHPPAEPVCDPYAPGSDDYAVRTREQVMELPGGLLRVDYGAAT